MYLNLEFLILMLFKIIKNFMFLAKIKKNYFTFNKKFIQLTKYQFKKNIHYYKILIKELCNKQQLFVGNFYNVYNHKI